MKHSNTLSSMEDELFREPDKHRSSGWWKWAPAIILGLLFVYRSTRPTMQLRTVAPPSFSDYSNTWNHAEREYHRRLAEAYWQVAVRRIQRYYSPDRKLPSDPPPQFRISGEANSLDTDVAASRVHYWYRLQQAWSQPDAWNVSYGWNTDWVESALSSLPQYVPQWLSDIFQDLIIFFNGIVKRISAP